MLTHPGRIGLHFLRPGAEPAIGRGKKTITFQTLHKFMLGQAGGGRSPVHFAQVVGQKTQRTGFCDGNIQLTQGARGGVARIGEGFPAQRLLLLIEGRKILFEHDHFAAHFQKRRERPLPAQTQGHGANGAHGLGDHLARFAVAAGQGSAQHTVHIDDFQSQTVQLGVAPEGRRQGAVELRIPGAPHALHKVAPVFVGKDIVQAVHPASVLFFVQTLQQAAAYPQGGRMRAAQGGPALFQFCQLPEQSVVLLVADLRRVQRMIQIIMAFQFGAEPVCPLPLFRRRLRRKKGVLFG